MLSSLATKAQAIYRILPSPAGIRGKHEITAKITVDKSGNVTNIEIKRGHPVLATASETALLEWKFKPYKRKSKIMVFTGTTTFVFTNSKVVIK